MCVRVGVTAGDRPSPSTVVVTVGVVLDRSAGATDPPEPLPPFDATVGPASPWGSGSGPTSVSVGGAAVGVVRDEGAPSVPLASLSLASFPPVSLGVDERVRSPPLAPVPTRRAWILKSLTRGPDPAVVSTINPTPTDSLGARITAAGAAPMCRLRAVNVTPDDG
jgi:hypothetical protein